MPPKRTSGRTKGSSYASSTSTSAEEQTIQAIINDPYSFKHVPCLRTDHAVGKRNCANNPNCLYGYFGERANKRGIWSDNPKFLSVLGMNPCTNTRLPDTVPSGMLNLGATCYLNALMQALYFTLPFRALVFAWEAHPSIWDTAAKHFESPLLFSSSSSTTAITTDNPNSSSSSSSSSATTPSTEDYVNDFKDMFALQRLFADMHYGVRKAVLTRNFVNRFRIEAGYQQDSMEFAKIMLDHFEPIFKKSQHLPTQIQSAIPTLFCGSTDMVTTCLGCGTESIRSDKFEVDGLRIPIQGKKSLEEAIQDCFRIEYMDADNAYACEHCISAGKGKQLATRSPVIRSLPPILSLQILRFDFSKVTGERTKVKEPLGIPDILDMTAIVRSANPKGIRTETDKASVPSSPVSSSTVKAGTPTRRNNSNVSTTSPSLIDDPCKHEVYELTAVLYHKGASAHHGHYVADVWDAERAVWWHFDDDEVSVVVENMVDGNVGEPKGNKKATTKTPKEKGKDKSSSKGLTTEKIPEDNETKEEPDNEEIMITDTTSKHAEGKQETEVVMDETTDNATISGDGKPTATVPSTASKRKAGRPRRTDTTDITNELATASRSVSTATTPRNKVKEIQGNLSNKEAMRIAILESQNIPIPSEISSIIPTDEVTMDTNETDGILGMDEESSNTSNKERERTGRGKRSRATISQTTPTGTKTKDSSLPNIDLTMNDKFHNRTGSSSSIDIIDTTNNQPFSDDNSSGGVPENKVPRDEQNTTATSTQKNRDRTHAPSTNIMSSSSSASGSYAPHTVLYGANAPPQIRLQLSQAVREASSSSSSVILRSEKTSLPGSIPPLQIEKMVPSIANSTSVDINIAHQRVESMKNTEIGATMMRADVWTNRRTHAGLRTTGSRNAYMLVYSRVSEERLRNWPEWQQTSHMLVPPGMVTTLSSTSSSSSGTTKGSSTASNEYGCVTVHSLPPPPSDVYESVRHILGSSSTNLSSSSSSSSTSLTTSSAPMVRMIPSEGYLQLLRKDIETIQKEMLTWNAEYTRRHRLLMRRKALYAALFLDPRYPPFIQDTNNDPYTVHHQPPIGQLQEKEESGTNNDTNTGSSSNINPPVTPATDSAKTRTGKGTTGRRKSKSATTATATPTTTTGDATDVAPSTATVLVTEEPVYFLLPSSWLRMWVCGDDLRDEDILEEAIKLAKKPTGKGKGKSTEDNASSSSSSSSSKPDAANEKKEGEGSKDKESSSSSSIIEINDEPATGTGDTTENANDPSSTATASATAVATSDTLEHALREPTDIFRSPIWMTWLTNPKEIPSKQKAIQLLETLTNPSAIQSIETSIVKLHPDKAALFKRVTPRVWYGITSDCFPADIVIDTLCTALGKPSTGEGDKSKGGASKGTAANKDTEENVEIGLNIVTEENEEATSARDEMNDSLDGPVSSEIYLTPTRKVSKGKSVVSTIQLRKDIEEVIALQGTEWIRPITWENEPLRSRPLSSLNFRSARIENEFLKVRETAIELVRRNYALITSLIETDIKDNEINALKSYEQEAQLTNNEVLLNSFGEVVSTVWIHRTIAGQVASGLKEQLKLLEGKGGSDTTVIPAGTEKEEPTKESTIDTSVPPKVGDETMSTHASSSIVETVTPSSSSSTDLLRNYSSSTAMIVHQPMHNLPSSNEVFGNHICSHGNLIADKRYVKRIRTGVWRDLCQLYNVSFTESNPIAADGLYHETCCTLCQEEMAEGKSANAVERKLRYEQYTGINRPLDHVRNVTRINLGYSKAPVSHNETLEGPLVEGEYIVFPRDWLAEWRIWLSNPSREDYLPPKGYPAPWDSLLCSCCRSSHGSSSSTGNSNTFSSSSSSCSSSSVPPLRCMLPVETLKFLARVAPFTFGLPSTNASDRSSDQPRESVLSSLSVYHPSAPERTGSTSTAGSSLRTPAKPLTAEDIRSIPVLVSNDTLRDMGETSNSSSGFVNTLQGGLQDWNQQIVRSGGIATGVCDPYLTSGIELLQLDEYACLDRLYRFNVGEASTDGANTGTENDSTTGTSSSSSSSSSTVTSPHSPSVLSEPVRLRILRKDSVSNAIMNRVANTSDVHDTVITGNYALPTGTSYCWTLEPPLCGKCFTEFSSSYLTRISEFTSGTLLVQELRAIDSIPTADAGDTNESTGNPNSSNQRSRRTTNRSRGKVHTFDNASSDWTLDLIKMQILQLTGDDKILSARFYTKNGTKLKSASTLASTGVRNGDTIYYKFKHADDMEEEDDGAKDFETVAMNAAMASGKNGSSSKPRAKERFTGFQSRTKENSSNSSSSNAISATVSAVAMDLVNEDHQYQNRNYHMDTNEENGQWECTACTYHNAAEADKCDICGAGRF